MSQITKESSHCDVHLHAEIVELRHVLSLRDQHIEALETACLRETDRLAELQTTLGVWQEKYDRLYDSHKRIQKVNQNLEDKLLRLVDRGAGERAQLTSDVATLSVRLAQANYTITSLQREVERYKNDMSLAIQLIQCKPDNFIPQKLNSLPLEVQSKVAAYMRLDMEGSVPGSPTSQQSLNLASSEYKIIPTSGRESPAPLCPFPPTAMVYSMRGYDTDGDSYTNEDINVSASIVAKVLEDGIKETRNHCDTCRCATKDLNLLIDSVSHYSISTQTYPFEENPHICIKCSSTLPLPGDTKFFDENSISSKTKNGPMVLTKKVVSDDLISFDTSNLGHHRLCDKSNKEDFKIDIISGCDKIDRLNLNGNSDDVLIDIEGTKTNGETKMSVSGSTSRMSQTSSKLFENFNRNLIQSIKTENPKSGGPRLCSLRIQDGSTNVILNKSENNMAPVLYTRRKLDLETEIPLSYPNNSSIIGDIVKMNKLDDPEKVRLFDNHLHKSSTNSGGGGGGIETTNRDSGINLSDDTCINQDYQYGVNNNVTDVDKLNSSSCDNTSQSLSSSMSSTEIRESAQLLRQQLHRVAEWVNANANLENRQSSDSEESHKNRSKGSYKSHRQSDNDFYGRLTVDYNKDVLKLDNAINGNDNVSEEKSIEREMTDLEQMEYNVKQFLLRQNEWSVTNKKV